MTADMLSLRMHALPVSKRHRSDARPRSRRAPSKLRPVQPIHAGRGAAAPASPLASWVRAFEGVRGQWRADWPAAAELAGVVSPLDIVTDASWLAAASQFRL
jgi:hypothetical protein